MTDQATHIYDFSRDISSQDIRIIQTEDTVVKSPYVANRYTLKPEKITYTGKFHEASNIFTDRPFILLCIKDNSDMLDFTLNNMKEHSVFKLGNVLVIDDRPNSLKNRELALKYDCSYLKLENSHEQFNFSMIHNIAVHVLNKRLGQLKEIILWSSDLWTDSQEVIATLIKKHREDKNIITGTKLLYPTEDFSYYKKDRAGSVQYGGSMFGPRPGEAGLFPLHIFRGYPPHDPKVNCEKGELFITGAFLIIDCDWYIETGGMCPSLKASYQDVDLCLRANAQHKRVIYYGKDLHLFHYENYTLDQIKEDLKKDQISDKLWYKGFWEPQRVKNLLYVHEQ